VAAYEVLLLNTAIPQIQAAQSGDTYVVPRDIAFSTVAYLANGTNLLPSLTFSSNTNTGIYREGADALGFTAGGGTNLMVLTTTGLGIGTNNPAQKLSVQGSSTTYALAETTGTGTSSGFRMKAGASADYTLFTTQGVNQFAIYDNVAASERLTLSSSGNLGLGVTPSAWRSFSKALQIGSTSSFQNFDNGGTIAVSVGNNFFWNSSDQAIYIQSNHATNYFQSSGQHVWQTAASGTADGTAATSLTSAQNGNSYTIKVAGTTDFTLIGAANNNVGTTFTKSGGTGAGTGTVSQNISFTQAMTLDASGNLLVGTTSALFSSANRGNINVGGSASSILVLGTGATTCSYIYHDQSTGNAEFWNGANGYLRFGTNNTERARITSGGNLDLQKNIGLGGTSATTSGTGITFPATQSASSDANTLDDYEEGTFDPEVTFGGGSTGLTYGSKVGFYRKIGSLVFFSFRIVLTGKGISTGPAKISIPFPAANISRHGGANLMYGTNFTTVTAAETTIDADQNASTATLYTITAGVSLTDANFQNTTDFIAAFCYISA